MTSNLAILASSSPPGYCDEFVVTPTIDQSVIKTPQPSRFQGVTEIPNSSSSSLPSPAELMRRPINIDPQVKTGSKAVEVPHQADPGFQTVSGLVKLRRLSISRGQEGGSRATPVESSPKNRPTRDLGKGGGSSAKAKAKKMASDTSEAKANIPKRKARAATIPAPKQPRRKLAEKAVPTGNTATMKEEHDTESVSSVPGKNGKKTAIDAMESADKLIAEMDAVDGACKASKKGARRPKKKTEKTSTHFDAGVASNLAGAQDSGGQGQQAKDGAPACKASENLQEVKVVASKRRSDWTPVKEKTERTETTIDRSTNEIPTSPLQATTAPARQSFSTLLENFNFDQGVHAIAPSSSRPQKESISGVGVNKRRRIEVIAPVGPAIPALPSNSATRISPKKKSPKKPFSITRHVTEKYQLQHQQSKSVGTDTTLSFFVQPGEPAQGPHSPGTPVAKKAARKPRAPRTKVTNNKKDPGKPKKSASKAKSATTSVNKLLSPSGAASQLVGQNILFGTSSQLLREGSPSHLRQLQQALRASEVESDTVLQTAPSSHTGLRFSSAALPRPGGRLWSKAAEHVEGNEPFPGRPPCAVGEFENHYLYEADDQDDVSFTVTQVTQPEAIDLQGEEVKRTEWRDVDDISLAFPAERVQLVSDQLPSEMIDTEHERIQDVEWKPVEDASLLAIAHSSEAEYIASAAGGFVDDDKPYHSKDPSNSSPLPPVSTLLGIQTRVALPQTLQTDRTALRLMSTNTKISCATTLDEPHRKSKKSTTTAKTAKPARLEQGPLPVKRGRGRPSKAKQTTVAGADVGANPATALTTTPTKALGLPAGGGSEWKDIDEIEDSEADTTPTTPRKRGRPRKHPQPLPELISAEAANKRVDTALLSARHAHWAEIQAMLFRQITMAIKANPPSKVPAKPSWNEKIALYDPIVIEDLTSWLHGNGIRIMVGEREEEVKGWMVQKWCEEHSVTCLWREGLWGGVKTKY